LKNYLFIHGALRGAWLWDRVIPLLQKNGAVNIIALDLPGHGKRADERADVNMSAYVNDVISCIKKKNLSDILVGHSMSGIIISRVAEEVPERIRHLVYLAAVVPCDGDALIDLLTKERQEKLRNLEGKASEIYGPIDALRPLYFTDLPDSEEKESFLKQLTPQPLAAFFEKIPLKRFFNLKIPRTYVLGLRDKSLPPELTRGFAERLGVDPVEIDAGHDMMISLPEEVAKVLLNIP
jgi:pimeloyl-ACP methyl ester carboxylesterase